MIVPVIYRIENESKKKVNVEEIEELIERILKKIDGLEDGKGKVVISLLIDLVESYVLTQKLEEKNILHIPVNPNIKKEGLIDLIRNLMPICIITKEGKEYVSKKNQTSKSYAFREEDGYLGSLSSGTTGKSKVIVYSKNTKIWRAKQMIKKFKITSNDNILCSSPYFHSLGQRLIHVGMLSNSRITYINEFKKEDFIYAFRRMNVTFAIPVTTHIEICKKEIKKEESHRVIISSSGSLKNRYRKEFIKEFKDICYEMYGLSEYGTCTYNKFEESMKEGCVGKTAEGMQIKIKTDSTDIEGNGRICVKGKSSFLGYIREGRFIDSDSLVNDEGYFETDDIGCINENGFLIYKERVQDILKVGSNKVSCKDIEHRLSSLLNNIDLIIVGIEMDIVGDCICCAIFTREDINERVVREEALKSLESHMRPMLYKVYKKYPVLDNGKVDLQRIKGDFRKDLEDITQ